MQADNSILASQVSERKDASRCTATAANQGTFELEGVVEICSAGSGALEIGKIAGQTVRVTPTTNLDTERGPLVVGAMRRSSGARCSPTAWPGGHQKSSLAPPGGVCVLHNGLVSAASFSGTSCWRRGEIVSLFGFKPGSRLHPWAPRLSPTTEFPKPRGNVARPVRWWLLRRSCFVSGTHRSM